MSWRVLIGILIVAAGASAWGGLQLGDWLVAHGPVAPDVPEYSDVSTVPVLDADGNPYTAQPPQPLMNGQMGVPEASELIAWEIPEDALEATTSNDRIAVSTTTISESEAREIALFDAEARSHGITGIADVGALGLGGGGQAGNQPIQPIEVAPPPPPPTQAEPRNNGAWQARLRQDLQACSALGFFDRPSCAWAARNKYCEPNNAWGRTPDCPAKSF